MRVHIGALLNCAILLYTKEKLIVLIRQFLPFLLAFHMFSLRAGSTLTKAG